MKTYLWYSDILCPQCNNDVESLLLIGKCAIGLMAWFGFLVVLWRILPSLIVSGSPIHGDQKNTLRYKLNGHFTFWVVVVDVLVSKVPLYSYYEPLALMDILL
jgi:hypothetical protein